MVSVFLFLVNVYLTLGLTFPTLSSKKFLHLIEILGTQSVSQEFDMYVWWLVFIFKLFDKKWFYLLIPVVNLWLCSSVSDLIYKRRYMISVSTYNSSIKIFEEIHLFFFRLFSQKFGPFLNLPVKCFSPIGFTVLGILFCQVTVIR